MCNIKFAFNIYGTSNFYISPNFILCIIRSILLLLIVIHSFFYNEDASEYRSYLGVINEHLTRIDLGIRIGRVDDEDGTKTAF